MCEKKKKWGHRTIDLVLSLSSRWYIFSFLKPNDTVRISKENRNIKELYRTHFKFVEGHDIYSIKLPFVYVSIMKSFLNTKVKTWIVNYNFQRISLILKDVVYHVKTKW